MPRTTRPSGSENSIDEDSIVEFYWRPGCPFCSHLHRKLLKYGIPLREFNIWEDPKAAQRVREIAGGFETVPTVVVRGVGLVNPSAREIRTILAK